MVLAGTGSKLTDEIRLSLSFTIMKINVLFFGILAEIAKTRYRHYNDIGSFSDLKLRIQDEYPELFRFEYRISVNRQLLNDEPVLNDGDEVAFLPPFAGE